MTRQPHDQFAKQYLAELLAPLGEVETSRDVVSEVRQVDVWFMPASSPSIEPQNLGLLGKMASTACLLEPFRNAPTPVEIRNCQLKLYALHGELLRKARREQNSVSEADLPRLWILSPSISSRLVNGFGAKLDASGSWGTGIYFLPEFQKTALIGINQLPVTDETLWLRLLGRDAVQQQAIDELMALPQDHPLRGNILDLLANWRVNVEGRDNLTDEDRELLMNLSPAYQYWREKTLQEGKQEGRQEGRQEGKRQGRLEERRQMVESLLKVRFDSLDEELSGAIAPMLQLPPQELTRLLLTLSREELIERFGYGSWRESLLQEVRLEERRQLVENFLKVRFSSLDEELSGAIAPLLNLPPEELTRLLITLSREELIEQFGGELNE
ncbi:MAG TPA: hypothetical protein DCL61_28265 [Cyanobacteria bacterium UBA12227]|nr:hypothetical protein [Cyanobacteria bacterium UBA12227]HAX86130.1 hypothetical protein [Cyanobacteria bacterium UBA11370]HBY77938.1 hypothetical protein [Cyanobacteria bacterium UBA11148]